MPRRSNGGRSARRPTKRPLRTDLGPSFAKLNQGPNVTFRILKEFAKVGVVSELVISIRHARPQDAAGLSGVHDAAWREAYQGVIPDLALRKMIARRGPRWWRSAA